MKRRLTLALTAFCFSACTLFAQEEGAHEKTASNLSPTLEMIMLWVNFALLAIGLGYLIKKYGGPFFAARSEHIQHEIVEAGKVRQEAESRAAEVDRRLSSFEAELEALRAESRSELESQQKQAAAKTSTEIARIQNQAEQEIAASGKAARLELKRYSAELAVQLAGEKIRARMTHDTQDALVRGFLKDLDGSASAQAHN